MGRRLTFIWKTQSGEDGQKHRPIMIHRVVFGSVERFIGILTEHFAGKFPFWLSPVQVKILPVSRKHSAYAGNILEQLKNHGLRAKMDLRDEKIGYKIREAQLEKIPYMIVVGEREETDRTIALRSREEGDLGRMTLEEFLERSL